MIMNTAVMSAMFSKIAGMPKRYIFEESSYVNSKNLARSFNGDSILKYWPRPQVN